MKRELLLVQDFFSPGQCGVRKSGTVPGGAGSGGHLELRIKQRQRETGSLVTSFKLLLLNLLSLGEKSVHPLFV